MTKKCIYTSPDQLPETLKMFHIENVLGVARATAYNRVKLPDFPKFQGDAGEAIRVNKNAFLRFIHYAPLELTESLAKTPMIWTVEEVAAHMEVCIDTAYELMRTCPAVVKVGRRSIVCREAWLLHSGYEEPKKDVVAEPPVSALPRFFGTTDSFAIRALA